MSLRTGTAHVVTTRRKYGNKVYCTHLLRRSYGEDGKVKNETLGNISHLPDFVIDLIRRSFKGETFVSANSNLEICSSRSRGQVQAVQLGSVALSDFQGKILNEINGQFVYILLNATEPFLLTAKRDMAAARRYLERAINLHGLPEKITIDKSGANTAAIRSVNADASLDIELGQSKYLNNIVEQDHRAVKRITDPMMGFKSFLSAQKLIAGIETMHMVKKGQLHCRGRQAMSAANQFHRLAF